MFYSIQSYFPQRSPGCMPTWSWKALKGYCYMTVISVRKMIFCQDFYCFPLHFLVRICTVERCSHQPRMVVEQLNCGWSELGSAWSVNYMLDLKYLIWKNNIWYLINSLLYLIICFNVVGCEKAFLKITLLESVRL